MKSKLIILAALFASPAMAEYGYFESFEDSPIGWLAYGSNVNAVASGINGINATDGSYYGMIGPVYSDYTGAYDTFGDNNAVFGAGFSAGTDIYIDLSDAQIAAGTYGFDFTVAINNSSGNHAQDNIFHVGAIDNGNGGYSVGVNASHNSGFALNPGQINSSPFGSLPSIFDQSGWYTFQVTFTPSAIPDSVDVLFEVLDDVGGTLFSASTLNGPAQYTLATAGGDRYGWLTYVETANGLAIDSTFVSAVPEPTSLALLGLGGLALMRRRRA